MAGRLFNFKLGKREQIGLAVAGFFVFAWFADFFVVEPMLRRFAAMNLQIDVARRHVELNRRILSQRAAAEEAWNVYRDKIRKAASTDMENAGMLGVVEELERETGVSLPSTKLREPVVMDYLEEYVVEADLETEMDKLMLYLYRLQGMDQLLRVQRLTLSPKSDATPTVVRGSMVITKVLTNN